MCLEFGLTLFSSSLVQKQAVNEIIKCNEFSTNYGLSLTDAQAVQLVKTRTCALNANGRIEFGGGIINKIIKGFCDSPYISIYNYEQTLHELIEVFYYYKNETLDLVSDDDLIKYMKKAFDGVCQGSLELLSGDELDRFARNLHCGYNQDFSDGSYQVHEGDEVE